MLFCIGCQTHKDESAFQEAPPTRKGRKYLWDCMECQEGGRDKTEQHLASLQREHASLCVDCGVPAAVDPEGCCKQCQGRRGFRFCSICGNKKLLHLDYYPRRSECVDCSGARRRMDYEQCSECSLWRKKGTECQRPSCPSNRQRKTCKRCHALHDGTATRICESCRRAAGKPLKCRWCKGTEPDLEFFSARVCVTCHAKPTDELRARTRLSSGLRKYGLTVEQFDQMLASQGGCCAICKKPSKRRLAVDHDHATGRIRGLLCVNCNLGLGNFQDNRAYLTEACDYLALHTLATRPA